MLAALAVWLVTRGFIKSLQPHYYPRVPYFYLSEVIISIFSLRAKLGNLNSSLQLEKTNQNQNITKKERKCSFLFLFLFLIPSILKSIFKCCGLTRTVFGVGPSFLPSIPDLEQALGARTGKIKAKQLRMKVILVKDEAYAQPVSMFWREGLREERGAWELDLEWSCNIFSSKCHSPTPTILLTQYWQPVFICLPSLRRVQCSHCQTLSSMHSYKNCSSFILKWTFRESSEPSDNTGAAATQAPKAFLVKAPWAGTCWMQKTPHL